MCPYLFFLQEASLEGMSLLAYFPTASPLAKALQNNAFRFSVL